MSPIKGTSEILRMPRLGKIHLGIKVEEPGKNPYPRATDYFVCPAEVQEVYGEEPRELLIMLPTEDPAQFAQQWLRRYSRTQGLTCIGDGQTCRQKTDTKTGAMVNRDSREWLWKEGLTCNPQECPEYAKKYCRRVLNLQFLLPEVAGLGVYQIDSSSFYSIVNVNSTVSVLKTTLGRCSMLPLKLVLGPVEVTPPGTNKKTVYIMHLSTNVKLANLAKLAQLPPAQALLPEPETEEPPEDLYPDGVLAEQEIADLSPERAEFAPDDLFPEDDLTLLRQEIGHLLGQGPRPADKQLENWWKKKDWGYSLQPQFFASAEPLPTLAKPEHLKAFRDDLMAYQERQAQTPQKAKSQPKPKKAPETIDL